ncbi:MAG TPA: glycoside hydrolase family 30 protein [Candidatus Atribacteria bacterium]|nr:glycoside hydrolase family 30 protein [Candidatus Atribacteria bacterium]
MKIKVYQTARDTDDRLSRKDDLCFAPDAEGQELQVINVYDDVEYQEIIGFGGAFTEAAADTFYKLSPDKRKQILDAYFNPDKGIGYTFCRTHINSCDFSLGNYCYVKDNDISLDSFSIERDRTALLPLIKEAMSVEGADFKLFSSPWSPPAWMKTNNQMNHGGKLKAEYYDAWARYYAKYIKAYAQEGVKIWGITMQNEPKAVQTWDSCVYTAEEEKDFVKNYLGPVLEKEGLGHVKIMIWDHNKERVYERARAAYEDPEAARYIYGTAFHWYSGDHFDALDAVYRRWPEKKLIFSEGCVSFHKERGAWIYGEQYGHEILGDLKHHTSAWTDWNMILNEIGGPNHVANYCDAPVMADTKNDTFCLEASYYYIGHFSKFIRPGSRRIGSSCFDDSLETVAFKTPDGSKVLVVLNRTDREFDFNLRYNDLIARAKSLPHSIMTLIF